MSLADWQDELSRFFYTRQPAEQQAADVLKWLADDVPVPPEIGIGVYRNNLLASIVLELRQTFSKTLGLLGREAFDEHARVYLYGLEAAGRGLGEVGEAFAAFLRARATERVADMADLEWAREAAFFAPADEPMGESEIRACLEAPAGQIRLELRSGMRLLEPHFPVHRERSDGPAPGLRVIVWRERGLHRADEVEPELWPVLRAIEQGPDLETIAALPEVSSHPERFQECLTLLLMRQWLAKPADA